MGESGSGKSTIARLLAMVYQPTGGEIRFEGKSLSALSGANGKVRVPRTRPDGVPGPLQLDERRFPGLARDHAGDKAPPARYRS